MIAQLGIFLFGATALYLVNDPRPGIRRWGPVIGLISQPFWYVAAFDNHQWGVLAASILYTASWARGVYHTWIRRA